MIEGKLGALKCIGLSYLGGKMWIWGKYRRLCIQESSALSVLLPPATSFLVRCVQSCNKFDAITSDLQAIVI